MESTASQQANLDNNLNAQYKRGILIPAKTIQKAYFVLDTQTGVIHVFKTLDQDKPSESFSLSRGTFPDKLRIVSDPESGKVLDSFEFRTANNLQFTVLAEDPISVQGLREEFQLSSQKAHIKNSMAKQFGKGVFGAIKVPWKIGKVMVLSLEKIGDGLEATQDYVFKQKPKQKIEAPSNVASGLAYGTKSMLTNMFSAVAGVIVEPVKGAKQGGIRGGAVGIGKGILGFVCKPVKGTIDLVTQTTRGIGNTPRTMYVGFNRMVKKVPAKKHSQNPNEPLEESKQNDDNIDPVNDILIGEENSEHIYINKKALKESIRSSQVLSALLYESEKHLSVEEQAKMKQVIMRQRELLRRREQVMKTEVVAKDQIKTITEELLKQLNESYNMQNRVPAEDDQLSQISGNGSETSSVADEREIQQKLQQILSILNAQKSLEQVHQEDIEEQKQNLSQFNETFAQDIFDEASTEDLQLFVIQAKELDQDIDVNDNEYEKFFEDARRTITNDEEEKQSLMPVTRAKTIQETMFDQDKQTIIIEKARNFRGYKQYKDDYRAPDAGYYGGFDLKDPELSSRLRSAGKEILKSVGKKILSGKFNLTTISFPIKCMCPETILEVMATIAGVNPIFITAAALSNDPIERLILVIAASIALIYPTHQFEKPLNPILGETYQALGQDGTMIYMEQTCHRPPITNFLFEGPQNLYKMHGWNSFSAKAWLNSCTLYVDGHKTIEFPDGTVITWNNQGDQLNNLFMGTLGHQLTGKIEFHDKKNNLYGWYELGNIKKKTQDYYTGEIHQFGKKILEIKGNYMGYMDVGSHRYFDVREFRDYYYPIVSMGENSLQSDATKRLDSVTLRTKNDNEAQKMKEKLEEDQRHDRKLRETAEARREKGGRKYAHFF